MEQSTKKLLNDSFTEEKEQVKKLLEEECKRPEHKRDPQRIDELVSTHIALMGLEETVEERTSVGMRALQARLREEKPRIRPAKRIRMLITAGIAAVMLLAANVFTVAAYQKDVFSVIVEYTEKSFSVKYPAFEEIVLPTTPDDPYGIKAECAKYGLEDVYAPTYLPEGFELQNCEHHVAEGYCTSVIFWFYRDQKEVISITYKSFDDPSCSSNIPCDNFDLTEIEIDGMPAIVSKEDQQCHLQFRKDANLEILIYTEYLDYQESDKIIASLG